MNAVSHITTECPTCRSSFRVSEEHLGKSAKCTSCGKGFVVKRRDSKSDYDRDLAPRRITVLCSICQTRLYGSLREVGELLTCPDCGTKTRLPPPERRKQTPPPAAMEGEQYPLWEGEDQPWGVDLAKEQPKLLPVQCSMCESLMYALPKQLGQTIDCPDCGHATVVKSPPKTTIEVTDDAYELDETDVSVVSTSLPPSVQNLDRLSDEERAKRIGRVATDRSARPQIPRWPLLAGWNRYLRAPGVIVRWISLSMVMTAMLALGATAYATTMGAGRGLAAFGAVAGLCFLCLTAMIGLLWFGAAAACAIIVVTESSEGNDQIQPWPSSNPIDWFGEAFYLLVTLASAAIPGWAMCKLAGGDGVTLAIGMLMSVWLCFPITLLSALEGASPWALVMPGVLISFARRPGTWLQFYLLSAAGFTLVAASLIFFANYGATLLLAVPIVVAAFGLYFRLIGRLAWRIRE